MGRVALISAGFLAAACTLVAWCCLRAGDSDDELEEEYENWF